MVGSLFSFTENAELEELWNQSWAELKKPEPAEVLQILEVSWNLNVSISVQRQKSCVSPPNAFPFYGKWKEFY